MLNLNQLKSRLEKLPQLKAESHLAATFGDYTQKVAQLRKRLEQARKDMGYITKVYPDSECGRKVLPLLQSCVRESKKLLKEIEGDSHKVKTRATDNKIVRMGEYSSRAITQCRDIWNRKIEGSVTKWEKIAEVVQGLGTKGGREFKEAVDKLNLQNIPQNDDDVNQVKAAQKALQKGIAGLGLEGLFGKFLEATAEGGASLRDLLKDEVREKMDEHELWDSFRVLLEQ